MRRTLRVLAVGALVTSVAVALPAGADGHVETVLTGVDNARGITFDADGNLYVASSGTGGDGPCFDAAEGTACYGETGAIHRLDAAMVDGTAEDAPDHVLLGGLPSHATELGGGAGGPADVSVGEDGRLYFTIGLGADPAVRDDELGAGANSDLFATLHSVDPLDTADLVLHADLGDLEATDPAGDGPDTNPFGVLADTANDLVTVADSGGNTVVAVDPTADPADAASVLAVLPPTFVPMPPGFGAPSGTNIPAQAVPTQHAVVGGTIHLGQLTGFPFAPGAAGVWAVDADGATPAFPGFTNIMDVAEAPDGSLLVLEIAHDGLLASGEEPPMGSLIRVTTDGDEVTRELLMDDLLMPGGMAVHPSDGHVYITQGSGMAAVAPFEGAGTVVRFDLSSAEPLVSVTDDAASTDEDETLTVDVAANDDGVVETTALGVAQGAVTDGSVVYQPPAHFTGTDTVPYRACNEDGNCVNGVLTVTVDETATDRIDGETRIETAVEASMAHYPDGAPQVLVARADLYPDALAGGPLAAAVGGPILLTAGDTLSEATAAEIARLGPTTVHVLGGPVAITDGVFDAIGEVVDDTRRIAGENRYETAVEIMEMLETVTGEAATSAYVVEGFDPDPTRGWPDAVAISGTASANGTPILLVETGTLPTETADAIDGLASVTTVGGPVAISAEVEAAIAALVDTLDEIEGATRYETSQKIAEAFDTANDGIANLAVVSGGNWPDALVAGPLTGPNGDGVILVHPSDTAGSPETYAFIGDRGPFDDLDLWGGPVAITTQVEAALADANG